MVSFTSISYSEVYRRGKIQSDILKKINVKKPDLNLAEKFEDDDDVQNVFHTLELSEELAMALDEEE